jgi:hypothetical protein
MLMMVATIRDPNHPLFVVHPDYFHRYDNEFFDLVTGENNITKCHCADTRAAFVEGKQHRGTPGDMCEPCRPEHGVVIPSAFHITDACHVIEANMTCTSKADALSYMHSIFHLHPNTLQRMIANNQFKWNSTSQPTKLARNWRSCPYCLLARGTRASFKGHTPRPEQKGSHFYVDLWGPNEEASFNGGIYVLGIIEATTNFVWIYVTATKHIENEVKHWLDSNIPKMRALHNTKTFVMQSDNGEFRSDKITSMIEALGGSLVTTAPYAPDTNARIERFWRT